ncbi:hypothetical protein OBBRIDRAFT_805309 [Obba rivulosa]|uniref:F-box domain-containing protein n=1 Tax=Obba rivulosa TaxID=1052685 RepID=A0A8E2AQH9_9APHY|nr:hypothetical protein OBBRIDRAFT_805309 [Obba rivulosa]
MAHLLQLNHDVLSLVLSYLPPSSLLSFALVSRAAHNLALPHLLAAPIIGGAFYTSRARGEASGPRQLTAFCTAVIAHPERACAVRALTVRRDAFRAAYSSAHAPDSALVALLARVLAQTRNLHTITLWNLAALLDAHPDLGNVLTDLPSLHTVRLGGEIPPADALLSVFAHATDIRIIDGARFSETNLEIPSFEEIDISSKGAITPGRRPFGRTLDRLSLPSPHLPVAIPVRCLELRNAIAPAPSLLPSNIPSDIASLLANLNLHLRDPDALPELADLPPAATQALVLIARTRPVVLRVAVDARLPTHAFIALLPRVAPQLRILELVRETSDDAKPDSESAVEWMKQSTAALASLPLSALVFRLSSPTRPRAFLSPGPAPPSLPPSHAPSPAHTRASTPAPGVLFAPRASSGSPSGSLARTSTNLGGSSSCLVSRASTPALAVSRSAFGIVAPVPTSSRSPIQLAAQAAIPLRPVDSQSATSRDEQEYTDGEAGDKPRTLPALAYALAKTHPALRFVALDKATLPAPRPPSRRGSSSENDPFAPRAFDASARLSTSPPSRTSPLMAPAVQDPRAEDLDDEMVWATSGSPPEVVSKPADERRWARTASGGVCVGLEEVVRVRAAGPEEGRRVGALVDRR